MLLCALLHSYPRRTAEPPSHSRSSLLPTCRNQRKKKALYETKARYNALVDENKQLLREREGAAAESYEVTEYLRREILNKNDRITELESQLLQVGGGKQ